MAADQLAGFGLPATVADARFAKPLDMDLLRQLAGNHEVLITVEEVRQEVSEGRFFRRSRAKVCSTGA